jgi:hypothetical protein
MKQQSPSVGCLIAVAVLVAVWVTPGRAQTQGGISDLVTNSSGAPISAGQAAARQGGDRAQQSSRSRRASTRPSGLGHLSPATVQNSIRLLETSNARAGVGDILETEDPAREKVNG